MNRGGLVLAALLAAVVPVPNASAKPIDPIVLTASGGAQEGTLRHAQETKKAGRAVCSVLSVDGPGTSPTAVQHDGNALPWRVADARKPVKVTAAYRRYVAPGVSVMIANGNLAVSLREVKQGTKVVAWDVVSGKITPGAYVIELTVEWKGACGTDIAQRVYHVFSVA